MDLGAILKSVEHPDEQCEECEKIDRGQLTLPERFGHWITPFCLFILDYDPFAIYKRTHKQTKKYYEVYSRRKLRIGLDKSDQLREQWRKIKLYLLAYLSVRYGLSILIQLVIYIKLHHDQADQVETTRFPLALEARKILEIVSIKLAQILGNPLSAMTGISLFLSCSIIICTLYSLGYMARRFSIAPMDAVNLRIYLSPEREFRRVDMIIRNKINDVMLASMIQPRKVSLRSCPPPVGLEVATPKETETRQFPVRAPVVLPLSICTMRPVIYSHSWFKLTHTRTLRIILGVVTPALPVLLYYAPRTIYTNALESLCEQVSQQLTDRTCSSNDVFSWPDSVAMIELLAAISLVGFIIGVQFILVVLHTWTQFDLSHDTEKDFRDSLELLKQSTKRYDIDLQRLERNPRVHELTLRNKIKADTMLFKTLIKTHVTLADYKTNCQFITHQVEGVLCVLTVTIVLLLLAENLKGLDLTLFRRLILTGAITITNAILLTAANCYNQMCRLEKIGWSILAELTLRSQRLIWLADANSELVHVYWRKLIQSSGMADKTNSIYPFGISLTYKNTLQFNFTIVSFFSYLRSF